MWLLVPLACGPSDPAVSGPPSILTGTCDLGDQEPSALADVELLAATDWLRFGALAFQAGDVFSNEAAYAAFQEETALELPAVDFAERLVIASWAPSDVCETHAGDWLVLDVGDRTHLHAAFEDRSACGTCDHAGGAVIAVSVPLRAELPTWCRAVVDTCP